MMQIPSLGDLPSLFADPFLSWRASLRARLLRLAAWLLRLFPIVILLFILSSGVAYADGEHHARQWWVQLVEQGKLKGWTYIRANGTCNGFPCQDLIAYGKPPLQGTCHVVVWRKLATASAVPEFVTQFLCRDAERYVTNAICKRGERLCLSSMQLLRILKGVGVREAVRWLDGATTPLWMVSNLPLAVWCEWLAYLPELERQCGVVQ